MYSLNEIIFCKIHKRFVCLLFSTPGLAAPFVWEIASPTVFCEAHHVVMASHLYQTYSYFNLRCLVVDPHLCELR